MDNHGTTETIVKATPNGETKVEKLDTCIKSHGHISLTVIDEEDGRWGHPGSSSSSDSALSTPCTVKEVEAQSLFNFWKTHRIVEKIVYVTAVLTLVFLVHALLTAQWLLPYYYAISAPVLILIRVILYWKFKWQFFLLDFCYAANTLWYIFIWAVPYSEHLFCVVFALANGPLLWAVVVYRNSLVFHSLDKVTSSFIHLLPVFLSFGIRWYGRTASWNWYRPFIPHLLEPSFVWLVAVPLGCFVLHSHPISNNPIL